MEAVEKEPNPPGLVDPHAHFFTQKFRHRGELARDPVFRDDAYLVGDVRGEVVLPSAFLHHVHRAQRVHGFLGSGAGSRPEGGRQSKQQAQEQNRALSFFRKEAPEIHKALRQQNSSEQKKASCPGDMRGEFHREMGPIATSGAILGKVLHRQVFWLPDHSRPAPSHPMLPWRLTRRSSPVTAAGPLPNFTGFPFKRFAPTSARL